MVIKQAKKSQPHWTKRQQRQLKNECEHLVLLESDSFRNVPVLLFFLFDNGKEVCYPPIEAVEQLTYCVQLEMNEKKNTFKLYCKTFSKEKIKLHLRCNRRSHKTVIDALVLNIFNLLIYRKITLDQCCRQGTHDEKKNYPREKKTKVNSCLAL